MLKKCFFCGSKNVVRNGLRGRTQRYKCKDCGRRFDGGIRRDKSQVITDYIEGKQTLEQLAAKYDVNERTIRHDLEGLFSDLKTKVRVHSGISKENRKKLLDEYIKKHY